MTIAQTNARPRLDRATFGLAWIQCVLAPLPHVTALDNLTLYALLACVIALGHARRSAIVIREPITIGVLLLSAILLFVSVLGPYPAESLNAWRKDYLPPLTVFGALLLTVRSRPRVVAILLAVIGGVALRLLIVAIELWVLQRPLNSTGVGFVHPYTHEIMPTAFYQGFVLIAAIYSPVIAAVLLRNDLPGYGRGMAWAALGGTLFLAIDYGSRTPLLSACAGMAVVCVASLQRRLIVMLFLVPLVAAAYLYWQQPETMARYRSLLSQQTYTNGTPGQGITIGDRVRVWRGIIEMADQRPVLGYGYGWKKLSMVVRDGGFLTHWQDATQPDPFTVQYFSRGYGGINPHNLAVHLYFESGWLGIVVFLALLVVVMRSTWRLLRSPDRGLRTLGILAGGFFAAWLVANIGNSIWAGQKLPFIVMALVAVALRLPRAGTVESASAGYSGIGQNGAASA